MRKSHAFALTVFATVFVTSCLPGDAVESVSRAQVEKLLTQAGMTVEDKTAVGQLPVLAVKAQDGNGFNVYLAGCESKSPNRDQGCKYLRLISCWSWTLQGDIYWRALEAVNTFNRNRWLGSAHIWGQPGTTNGSVCVAFASDLTGGVREKSIQVNVDNFLLAVDDFRTVQALAPATAR